MKKCIETKVVYSPFKSRIMFFDANDDVPRSGIMGSYAHRKMWRILKSGALLKSNNTLKLDLTW